VAGRGVILKSADAQVAAMDTLAPHPTRDAHSDMQSAALSSLLGYLANQTLQRRPMGKTKTAPGKQSKDAANTTDARRESSEMLFESDEFRSIPVGVKQVLLKIALAGDSQSVNLGVAVFEQLTTTSQFVVMAKQEIDNLASTPEQSFLAVVPKPGARYVITFVGEMHALTLSNEPLSLQLLVTGDGVGSPIEDFKGSQSVDNRFCSVRGRALLTA
jgi:hypothetical protein